VALRTQSLLEDKKGGGGGRGGVSEGTDTGGEVSGIKQNKPSLLLIGRASSSEVELRQPGANFALGRLRKLAT